MQQGVCTLIACDISSKFSSTLYHGVLETLERAANLSRQFNVIKITFKRCFNTKAYFLVCLSYGRPPGRQLLRTIPSPLLINS